MSLLSKTKELLFGKRKSLSYLSGPDLGNSFSGIFGTNWNRSTFLETYGKSLYVYACVSKIAEKVASVDFKLNRIINTKGEVEEVMDHPALDLLYKANPFYTKEELLMTDTINRKLTGDSFLLKIRNNSGEVVELWNVRPDYVTIYPDKENYINRYEVLSEDGKKFTVAPEDMIHIKYPSPLEMFFGMSPLSAAQERIDTEEYASKYQRSFFQNNARPDAIIEMPEGATAEQMAELRDSWEKRHKGEGRNSRLGVLQGGAIYKQISLTQREMDYIESMKATRDDILVAFKVPKPIVAVTDDVNRANAETAAEIFLSETIVPELRLLVGKLNEELIIPDFGEEYVLDFEDPVPVNREMRLLEFQAGCDRWMTPNEIRQQLGDKPIDGGDSLLRQISMVPIANVGERINIENRSILYGRKKLKIKLAMREQIEKELTGIKDSLKKKLRKGVQDNSLFKDIDRRKQYLDYRNKDIDQRSQGLRLVATRLANEQRDEFLKKFRKEKPKTKREIQALFNRKEQNKIFRDRFLPLITEMYKEAGQDAMSMVSLERPFSVEKDIGPETFKWLLKRATFFADTTNETTLLHLVDTLSEGIDKGEGIKALSERIKGVYNEFSDYRSALIARTETTSVVNAAHEQAYVQSGVVKGKEWIATLDDRVRDEHLLMDGEQVKLGERFSNGLDYPSEPNCRCTIAPVTIMEE